MFMETLTYAMLAVFVLSLAILIAEVKKKEDSRSTLLQIASIVTVIITVVIVLMAGTIMPKTEIGNDLENGQVYYLHNIIRDQDNPELVSLIISEADAQTGDIKNRLIIINWIKRDQIAPEVAPGKFIEKNSHIQIEIWKAPIET